MAFGGISFKINAHSFQICKFQVNISPSLHSGTPLDVSVKAPLAKDVLNMAGIYVPPR